MKLVPPLLWAWCFGSVAAACTSDLTLSLDGLRCNSTNRCSAGYACQKDAGICVRNSPGSEPWSPGGSGGDGAVPSSGGAGAGNGGIAGNGGVLGDGGNSGSGGLPGIGGQGGEVAGAGGAELDLDAGPPELVDGGADGCVPTTLFRDRDGDTFGDVSSRGQGCAQRGWVTRAGDCRDDIAVVNPDQDTFFSEGFVDQNKPGDISFDYDCTGTEDADQTNNPSTGQPNCSELLDPVSCMGTGYLPVAGRVGFGINALCGSVVRRDCVVLQLLNCRASDTNLTVQDAFRCK